MRTPRPVSMCGTQHCPSVTGSGTRGQFADTSPERDRARPPPGLAAATKGRRVGLRVRGLAAATEPARAGRQRRSLGRTKGTCRGLAGRHALNSVARRQGRPAGLRKGALTTVLVFVVKEAFSRPSFLGSWTGGRTRFNRAQRGTQLLSRGAGAPHRGAGACSEPFPPRTALDAHMLGAPTSRRNERASR